jgi:transcription antitermination factor NusB
MSGTRRKARECALQILFAADLVENPPSTLSEFYWGEFGFDELHSGSNKLVEGFLADADKIDASLGKVKTLSKKVTVLAELTNLSKDIKDILRLTAELGKQYRKFVKAFVAKGEVSEHSMALTLGDISTNIGALERSVKDAFGDAKRGGQNAERATVKESVAEARALAEGLLGTTIPAVEKLMKELRGSREFGDKLAIGALSNLKEVDERIKTRAEHWRIERMAIVDRNILRLAVYEFLHEDTPHTVVINEALEIARRFSTFEATQFINGILDAIKQDLEKEKV